MLAGPEPPREVTLGISRPATPEPVSRSTDACTVTEEPRGALADLPQGPALPQSEPTMLDDAALAGLHKEVARRLRWMDTGMPEGLADKIQCWEA